MATLRRAALILCTALAAPWVGSPAAHAGPSVVLTGFGDFSGAQTQLGFDDLGLVNGAAIPSTSGASFSLSGGLPATYIADGFARESGIAGVGAVNNFMGATPPWPELVVNFASPIHRVGFEARVNASDQVVVTLLAGGQPVDQVALASHGSDQLYFYGLENTSGFDEVHVDALEGESGAFTFDNLTFETLVVAPPDPPEDPGDPGEEPPTEEPPAEEPPAEEPPAQDHPAVVSCDGFAMIPRAYRGRDGRPPRARALLAELHDANGAPLTSDDLESPPNLRVWFTPDSGGAAVDVTNRVAWRGDAEFRFVGRRLQRWFIFMLPRRMDDYGTYMTMLESGDSDAYTVDPTCADWTVNERPKPKPKPSPKHGPKHHGRR